MTRGEESGREKGVPKSITIFYFKMNCRTFFFHPSVVLFCVLWDDSDSDLKRNGVDGS
jgi:hypothetical protein